MHRKSLRENLQTVMDRRGFSATKLADLSGVSQPTISRFLNGTTDTMEVESLLPIAEQLGVTVSQLLGEIPIDDNQARQHAYILLQNLPAYQVPAAVKILDALGQPAPKQANDD